MSWESLTSVLDEMKATRPDPAPVKTEGLDRDWGPLAPDEPRIVTVAPRVVSLQVANLSPPTTVHPTPILVDSLLSVAPAGSITEGPTVVSTRVAGAGTLVSCVQLLLDFDTSVLGSDVVVNKATFVLNASNVNQTQPWSATIDPYEWTVGSIADYTESEQAGTEGIIPFADVVIGEDFRVEMSRDVIDVDGTTGYRMLVLTDAGTIESFEAGGITFFLRLELEITAGSWKQLIAIEHDEQHHQRSVVDRPLLECPFCGKPLDFRDGIGNCPLGHYRTRRTTSAS